MGETNNKHRCANRTWKDLTKEEQVKKNSLLYTILRNDWKLFAGTVFLILVGEISKFVQPFLIAELVSFFKVKGSVTVKQAWGYALGMVLLTFFYSVISTYGEFLGQILAMRWRASCTALMSRKASRLSSKSLSELSTGTVINLLATDVEKFYNAAMEFRGLFVGPLVLLTLLLIMAATVGFSILPALAFVTLLTAFRLQIGNISGRLRLKLADRSDKRILLVTEIVTAMRMIKAYCWENLFRDRAQALRGKEVQSAGWVIFLNSLNLNLGYICDKVVTFFLVLTFILSGHVVDYKLAIQILTWMKMGQLGFLNFPIGYSMWKQMEASLSRIQMFLLAEEFTGYDRIRRESVVKATAQVKIILKNCSASWSVSEKWQTKAQKMMKHSILRSISAMSMHVTGQNFVASGTFSLRNISLEVKNGMLVGLVGPVGSGKTSLLLVILGNLKIEDGTRKLRGKIAYVPQQPWIRADTVRNNILMGEKLDRDRYSRVLSACALQKDVAAMTDGDATMIGDKGSSLSAGQRARISLARAVYRDADIYILDDPFSSLDSKVGTHIFHECVQGLLKDKLVVMATHYVHLLKYTDQVVVLKDGRMLASGSLENVKACVNLSKLIKDPENTILDQTEIHDVFEREDKKNLLMPLLSTDHIKKEHAHIPINRATPFHVYLKYWRAGHGPILMTLFSLILIGHQALTIMGEWWLVYQLSGGSTKSSSLKDYNSTHSDTHPASLNATNLTSSFTVEDAHLDHETNYAAASNQVLNLEDQTAMLSPYALYIMLSLLMGFLSVVTGTAFIVMAARNLYNSMFNKLLWAPMKTFSSDKTGQMMNRFVRDTGRLDDIIPITINATFMTAAIILSQISYICVINAYVVIATLPFLVGLMLFVLYAVRSIRDTKRLESEFRTPTFEHLKHMLTGLEVIRAFGMEMLMIKESDSYLDRHTAAWHMYIGSIYWMKMRINWLVTLYLAVVLVIALASPNKEVMATPLGLSLAYIIVFMQRIQYFATYATMLDTNMTAVEHMTEYASLDQEAPPHSDYDIPPGWPSEAHITFQGINLIYPGSRMFALKNIIFDVMPREKVGIVGRTGAGKSSLLNVLLRLENYEGVISIDDVDISKVGLADLRSKITFILQEPQLQTGTLRYNLDPWERFTDTEVWDALAKVNLKRKVAKMPGRLSMGIEPDGNNFSGGQKQLLCMARALLNMHKIMLLDEITANIDKKTDTLLHKMISEEFKECTILHISHRIETLIEYDNILVIDSGNLVEYDHPHLLLQNPEGQFHSMVKQLGPRQAMLLHNIAAESYEHNYTTRLRRRCSNANVSPEPDFSEDHADDTPTVPRLSANMYKRVHQTTRTKLHVDKMAMIIENHQHNGMVVQNVKTMPRINDIDYSTLIRTNASEDTESSYTSEVDTGRSDSEDVEQPTVVVTQTGSRGVVNKAFDSQDPETVCVDMGSEAFVNAAFQTDEPEATKAVTMEMTEAINAGLQSKESKATDSIPSEMDITTNRVGTCTVSEAVGVRTEPTTKENINGVDAKSRVVASPKSISQDYTSTQLDIRSIGASRVQGRSSELVQSTIQSEEGSSIKDVKDLDTKSLRIMSTGDMGDDSDDPVSSATGASDDLHKPVMNGGSRPIKRNTHIVGGIMKKNGIWMLDDMMSSDSDDSIGLASGVGRGEVGQQGKASLKSKSNGPFLSNQNSDRRTRSLTVQFREPSSRGHCRRSVSFSE